MIQDGVDTRGRHPWHLTAADETASEQTYCPTEADTAKGILAIGESGLDRLCNTPYDLQLRVFRDEVARSERLHLPLFLHCVRAIDDALCLRHESKARQPWIWHGYRGGIEQLRQLLSHGFFFSFGPNFREEALRQCPIDRLLLETDDNISLPIADHYAEVARLRGMATDELLRQMHANFITLFPSRD